MGVEDAGPVSFILRQRDGQQPGIDLGEFLFFYGIMSVAHTAASF